MVVLECDGGWTAGAVVVVAGFLLPLDCFIMAIQAAEEVHVRQGLPSLPRTTPGGRGCVFVVGPVASSDSVELFDA